MYLTSFDCWRIFSSFVRTPRLDANSQDVRNSSSGVVFISINHWINLCMMTAISTELLHIFWLLYFFYKSSLWHGFLCQILFFNAIEKLGNSLSFHVGASSSGKLCGMLGFLVGLVGRTGEV
jgi:hypothetical protein